MPTSFEKVRWQVKEQRDQDEYYQPSGDMLAMLVALLLLASAALIVLFGQA